MRRYDLGFYIGPCSEEDANALVGVILDLPEFRAVHGGGIEVAAVADDDPVFAEILAEEASGACARQSCVQQEVAESSKGRTAAFEAENPGSIPGSADFRWEKVQAQQATLRGLQRAYETVKGDLRAHRRRLKAAEDALEPLRLGVEAALAHAEGLRMDTPEDERVRLALVETLRLALALLRPVPESDKNGD